VDISVHKAKKALSKMPYARDKVRLPIFSAAGPGLVPKAAMTRRCCNATMANPAARIDRRGPA